jgi:hypothetical protein
MFCDVEVFRRVLVRRGIAAADVPAFEAFAQVNPLRADFKAILAAC